MNCLSWNITAHGNSKDDKATQQAWGSKKKKGRVGGKYGYFWPFQEPNQLLALSQILGLTFFEIKQIRIYLFSPLCHIHFPSASLSFLLRAKACQRKDSVPNYVRVQLPKQWGAHLRNEQWSHLPNQRNIVVKNLPLGTAAIWMACYIRVSQGHNDGGQKWAAAHSLSSITC